MRRSSRNNSTIFLYKKTRGLSAFFYNTKKPSVEMTEGVKFRIGIGGKTLEQVNLYARPF